MGYRTLCLPCPSPARPADQLTHGGGNDDKRAVPGREVTPELRKKGHGESRNLKGCPDLPLPGVETGKASWRRWRRKVRLHTQQ